MHPDLRITNEAYSIFLFKTAPGLESTVYSNLSKVHHSSKAQILLGFGDYDLLSISRSENTSYSPPPTGSIPNILGARQVVCFGIQHKDEDPGIDLISSLKEKKVFSLTFIRVPGFFTHKDNLRPEEKFLDWWWEDKCNNSNSVDQFLLGTLGGPEFVIVHAGDSLKSVHRWIKSKTAGHSSIEKSHSIIAVNGAVLNPETLSFPLGPCYQDLGIHLKVSCRPSHSETMLNYIDTIVENIAQDSCGDEVDPHFDKKKLTITKRALVTGLDDFIVSLSTNENFPLNKLIQIVLAFRRKCSEMLLGTSIIFQHLAANRSCEENSAVTIDEAIEEIRKTAVPSPRLHLTAEESKIIGDLPEVGPVAVRALYQFGNILQNPLLANDLIDLFNYFQSFKTQALSTSPKDVKARTMLADRLTPAHHGVDQRTIGANEGVNPVESNIRHMLGGTQKIMQAAEAIPLSVFRQFNNALWPGFLILGSYREFQSHYYNVLNLPTSYMWEPSRWVGLLHESVHGLLCTNSDFFSTKSGRFADLKRELELRAYGVYSVMDKATLEDLALEVFTDLIELNYGPHWNPELVLKARWQYYSSTFSLEDLSDFKAYSYALRSLYSLGSIWGDCTAKDSNCEIPESFEPLMDKWKGIYTNWDEGQIPGIKAMHERLDPGKISELMETMWYLHKVASPVFPFNSGELKKRQQWWNQEAEGNIKQIKRGIPVSADEVRYPELFVWKLFECFDEPKMMSIPQRTAAILSLHDWYRWFWTQNRDVALDKILKSDEK